MTKPHRFSDDDNDNDNDNDEDCIRCLACFRLATKDQPVLRIPAAMALMERSSGSSHSSRLASSVSPR
jgi:polyferredoxin